MAPSLPSDLLGWLAALPATERDAALEERLGIRAAASAQPPGAHLIGYHPSGVAAIVRALFEAPVGPQDVFVDLGSGLGKVALLAGLLTEARVRGIEIQPALVEHARTCAAQLELAVTFSLGDVRDAPLDDGTVFFLYLPFEGPALAAVLDRLRAVAERRAIVVCALGIDLGHAQWLTRRELDSFWLEIYDSRIPNVRDRPCVAAQLSRDAERVAYERDG